MRCLPLPHDTLAPAIIAFIFSTPLLSLALQTPQHLSQDWWCLWLHTWHVYITCLRRKLKVNSVVPFQKREGIIPVDFHLQFSYPTPKGLSFFDIVLEVHHLSPFMYRLLFLAHSSFSYFNIQLLWVHLKQEVWAQRPVLFLIPLPGLVPLPGSGKGSGWQFYLLLFGGTEAVGFSSLVRTQFLVSASI